ncbi:hypothetical protein RJ640_030462 [Escallonia rubra]|uniref:DNA polymerase n=1 Tax=Escallonia rubra TaxID=112253 RepID=A0AA88U3S3_9ASTE|nr:hypothetical protein RJ640_030462 [Escallonia rubra]
MEDEQPTVAGRRRSRGAAAGARASALERLRALRRGERPSDGGAAQVKMHDPIYDTVDEDEYDALVAKRREEVRGFIVDDNGLGYGDEGEEDDWTQAGGPPSSEESEGEPDKPKKKKPEKKEKPPKKPSLLAAAASMNRQRISSMFTSSVFKKSRDDNAKILSSDSIVDDVIAEFAPDEADREMRRKGHVLSGAIRVAPLDSGAKIKSETGPRAEISDAGTDGGCLSADLAKSEVVDGDDLVMVDKSDKDLESEMRQEEVLVESVSRDTDVKAEEVVKKEVYKLNAKVKEEKEGGLGAAPDWEALMSGGGSAGAETNAALMCEENRDFELDSDGSLPFYILDAHEEFYGSNAGNLYLFGKVKAASVYQSCCVVVKNMQRCLYAVPDGSVFPNDMIARLEREVEESKISHQTFKDELREMASGLNAEVKALLMEHNVFGFATKPVKRNYAFERSDIPLGENYFLKINYSYKYPPLPSDIKGKTFCAMLGTHCRYEYSGQFSALELLLIKRKIKGPSWLSISKFSSCPVPQRISWCRFEVTIDSPSDIQVSTNSKHTAEIPPVVVTAINLKTIINDKQNINEIVSASVICCHKTKIDTPMLKTEWKRPGMLSHFTVVRKLEGGIFPMGFTKEARDKNSKAGSDVISFESRRVSTFKFYLYVSSPRCHLLWYFTFSFSVSVLKDLPPTPCVYNCSERALLNRLMIELHKLDSDVLVGHNISGFDLDVLLHRAQACRVPSSMWSKVGRLKRSVMPKLTKGSTTFGSGASPGIMSCVAGRVLCDTFLCSRELLKEVSYSLTQLAKTQLGEDRKEISPHDIPQMLQSSESLIELIRYGEKDAWLSMELMFHLSLLPLTRQLTNISGNLWGKTLQGARAQRVEYLLLHAFHAKKFIVPDKFSSYPKETKLSKRKLNDVTEDKGTDDVAADDAYFGNEVLRNDHGKTKKGPGYLGGLVLEPKIGLYDKFILLLDFNSLYPSIIQEYNICFTTVERSSDELVPRLPSSKKTGVLPELLKNLVERRRMIKSWLKTASGLKVQQLDIQQQALKLTANSMYGCLGFSNSRFYAKPLAELITLQGREILQSTVDLVQNKLNLEVIYGDTDSIMIYSGLDDIAKAKAIAGKVIQEVNKKYKCLEIDLDGLYKRMLLLKKKKYAAVKVQFIDGPEVKERKGLDIVRRDWSVLSKEVGEFCLDQILSEKSCEEVVESIHNELKKVQEDMRNGEIALEKYVITKTLTRPPEAYPDAKSQPHVEVALRLKQSGVVTGCSAGDTVPYIICCEQGNNSTTSTGVAQRARHPEELKKDDGKWIIDIDYYLAQQIHPVISRLCASIQGTSPARLADCLGLESSKFQSKSTEAVNDDPSNSLLGAVDDEERYRGCEPLVLSCPSCSGTFECPIVFGSVCSSVSKKPMDLQDGGYTGNFWGKFRCPKCPEEGEMGRISPALIANQVKRQAEGFISAYYKGLMTCDDETCKYTSRSLNLRVIGDSERGTVCPNYPHCNGRLVRKYAEADLYKQLAYFCHALDTERCIDKFQIEATVRIPVEKELARIRPLVQLAAATVEKIRDRCAYGWVQLKDLTITI